MTSLIPRPCRSASSGVEVRERPEHRLDVLVVADVVAVVVHRRRVDRRQPQHVHPEVLQVVQPRAQAGEVADAVTVAVGEAARVDLVDDGAAPPRVGLHGISCRGATAGPATPGGPRQ
jgi:hypothetical protein